jgi:LPS-assembly lipoprotein
MWLSEGMPGRISAIGKLLGLLSLLVLAQACTVAPLYGSKPEMTEGPGIAALGKIAVKPANARPEQQVRNHLIFLLGQNGAEPAKPNYSLALHVKVRTVSAGTQQAIFDPTTNEGQPTSGTVIMTSDYVLTDASTGKEIATGSRSASSEFDRPRQEFANDRALRDAQDRAARELAELLRLSIAQDLSGK